MNHLYPYICIEGNIGTGKTSLTTLLSQAWDAYPIYEEFTDNPFLPKFYKDPERYGFQVELFFMTERHKQLERIRPGADLFQQVYIADYFFHKTMLFAGATLREDDYRLFKRLFDLLEQMAPQPDMLVYVHRDIDLIHEQILQRGREMELGIDKDYLRKIQDSYLGYLRHITHYPVLIIEAHDLDFVGRTADLEAIMEVIDQPYQPGVVRVTP